MNTADWLTAARLLREGAVGILPTDTIYGFSASIHKPESISRIYSIKERDLGNPLVILASSLKQIEETFPVLVTEHHHHIIQDEQPTSVIYQVKAGEDWGHPHYQGDDLAIRIPMNHHELIGLLEKTGPIVSTSVNKQGSEPLLTPTEIAQIFGDHIDFFIDAGSMEAKPSRIVRIETDGTQTILR